eukprot:TRINITY_DN9338_c0_g1_i3.p1 TRINITY_DN9338_c0_g1~~TRINITY_DN9338_c0_g1_i3.p1  ORF type:complete len:115 (+),score=31.80 TRINITY_DN9338_c0_g1_i3:47-391(+)
MPGKPKKEAILNLEKHTDRPVHVKFSGGREVTGILKGFDTALNLVLDETREYLRDLDDHYKRRLVEDPDDPSSLVEETRYLGIVVCRGTAVMCIMPYEGTEEIANPFLAQAEIA